MPQLSISRTQLDRLGKRLAATEPVSDEDYGLLEAVLGTYEEVKLVVLERLQDLGFVPTGRTKTTGTLIDKLRREQGMGLKGMQDLAGARLIVPGTRVDQDEAVAAIAAGFRDLGEKPPDVTDRRLRPSSGYRAVHVIVTIGKLPAEIQVRTELQDLWAQAFERLGIAGDAPSATAVTQTNRRRRPSAFIQRSPGVGSSSTWRSSATRFTDWSSLGRTRSGSRTGWP